MQPALSKTPWRPLARIAEAVLARTGRLTHKGIRRWTEPGGRYRSVPRFFPTPIDWLALPWRFFGLLVYDRAGVSLLVGDETVVSKAGKKTFGIDRFFRSLCDCAIPSGACFSLALDGHFGNHASCQMARQLDLPLISRVRADAALYAEPTAAQRQGQPRRNYGDRIDLSDLPGEWLRWSPTEDGYPTEVDQGRCRHKQSSAASSLPVVCFRESSRVASGRSRYR